MPIIPENFKWADSDVTDGVTGQPNKVEPDPSMKTSGLLREEPLVRPHLNYQFDQYHKAFVELQSQIDVLVLDAGTAVLQKAFPIGSVYTSTTSIVDPSDAALLGFGTWVRLKGKFLVGLDDTDSSFDGLGETGGTKVHSHGDSFSVDNHVLTTAQLPAHTHTTEFAWQDNNKSSEGSALAADQDIAQGDTRGVNIRTSDSTGSNQGHTHGISGYVASASNLPPYYTAYMWRRTA